jgi:hypothetical protein
MRLGFAVWNEREAYQKKLGGVQITLKSKNWKTGTQSITTSVCK